MEAYTKAVKKPIAVLRVGAVLFAGLTGVWAQSDSGTPNSSSTPATTSAVSNPDNNWLQRGIDQQKQAQVDAEEKQRQEQQQKTEAERQRALTQPRTNAQQDPSKKSTSPWGDPLLSGGGKNQRPATSTTSSPYLMSVINESAPGTPPNPLTLKDTLTPATPKLSLTGPVLLSLPEASSEPKPMLPPNSSREAAPNGAAAGKPTTPATDTNTRPDLLPISRSLSPVSRLGDPNDGFER